MEIGSLVIEDTFFFIKCFFYFPRSDLLQHRKQHTGLGHFLYDYIKHTIVKTGFGRNSEPVAELVAVGYADKKASVAESRYLPRFRSNTVLPL